MTLHGGAGERAIRLEQGAQPSQVAAAERLAEGDRRGVVGGQVAHGRSVPQLPSSLYANMRSMRWSEQEVGVGAQASLPGADADVVVRRFDAPEALDMRFHEVRAKSALNRVPVGSRVPFEWTVNPYRGCSHACTYCAAGDTPVLLADGRLRQMADLTVGDRVMGTGVRGRCRRYVETPVLDHWSTVKPAFRTTLEDGTTLVTSGDHRLLTGRGWKHVSGGCTQCGQRPHLTTSNELLGTGMFAEGPRDSPEYRHGYLCGMVRGDGTPASRNDVRPGGRRWIHHFLRLALVDLEALRRAQAYLADAGGSTGALAFATATADRRAVRATRTQARASVERIAGIIAWPPVRSDDWRKGFLAGIFDADGSCSGHILRIANADRAMLDCTLGCLSHFGFDAVEEFRPGTAVRSIRVRGGLRERLRFFHLTDPAITRKRTVTGTALQSDARTRVVSVVPLGRAMRLYDITTGTGDFISNGVVSHNCFARPTHEYLDMDAGRDFEREIVVKVNVPEVLRAELARPSWKKAHVALGTNTDPYQWVEGRYKLMRGIWEAMRDFANPCSVLTKSPLVLRDADLLLEIAERTTVSACLSIPTLEEKAWRATEPHTPHPRARLEAVAELNRRGVPTGILVAPLMPGINDDPAQVERILELATEAGAKSVGGQTLFLRGSTRDVFMDWLRTSRPDLVERYEALYARGAYAPKAEQERIAGILRRARRASPMVAERFFRRGSRPALPPAAPAPPVAPPRSPPPPPEQASLF